MPATALRSAMLLLLAVAVTGAAAAAAADASRAAVRPEGGGVDNGGGGGGWVRVVMRHAREALAAGEAAGARLRGGALSSVAELRRSLANRLGGGRAVGGGATSSSASASAGTHVHQAAQRVARAQRTVAAVQKSLSSLPPFLKSSCVDSNTLAQLPQLQQLGVNTVRVYCNWRYLESSLATLDTSLTVQSLRENTSWIEPYSASLNWNLTDNTVNVCTQNNIIPLIEIGEGTDHCLPTYAPAASGVADPGAIGPQLYLAYMYRYSRAVVHRYKDRVPLWQIENELNDAYIEAVGGIRSPHTPLHSENPWGNFTFVTQLLETLYLAVKDEDAALLTTQNVLVGTPQNAYSMFRFQSYYLDAIQQWEELLDVVSFDYYPNMFTAWPDNSADIADKVSQIRSVLKNASRPIMLAETGLTVMNGSVASAQPPNVQWSDAEQEAVVTSALTNFTSAGGFGFQLFKTSCNDGFLPPPDGYSSTDVDFLNTVTQTILSNDIDILLEWVLRPRHLPYVLSGRPIVVASTPPTTAYGVLYSDCSPRPALPALAKLYAGL